MRPGGLPPCTRSSVAPGRSGSWSLSPILGGKPTLTGPLAVFPDKWIHSILFLSPKANSRALLLSLSTGQDLRQACVVHALLGCCGGAGGGGRLGVFISVLGRWPGEARCCTVSCPAGLLPAVWAPERGWGASCCASARCRAAQLSTRPRPASRRVVGPWVKGTGRQPVALLSCCSAGARDTPHGRIEKSLFSGSGSLHRDSRTGKITYPDRRGGEAGSTRACPETRTPVPVPESPPSLTG